jgi:hypothetical protein
VRARRPGRVTPEDLRVLEAIVEFTSAHGGSPTIEEVAQASGRSSRGTAWRHVEALIAAGRLERDGHHRLRLPGKWQGEAGGGVAEPLTVARGSTRGSGALGPVSVLLGLGTGAGTVALRVAGEQMRPQLVAGDLVYVVAGGAESGVLVAAQRLGATGETEVIVGRLGDSGGEVIPVVGSGELGVCTVGSGVGEWQIVGRVAGWLHQEG